MSVDAELLKDAQLFEYILCIEGVGWPTDETTLASGFDGTVFVTNDLNADLATVLGCSIHHGLEPPSAISDSLDPKSYAYTPGDLSFTVVESEDDLLETTFRPHSSTTSQHLHVAFGWGDTSVQIDGGNNFANGDVVWIAGREALLLSAKAIVAGSVYSFTATRGYLGTPRGKRNARPTGLDAFQWAADTEVYSRSPFDHDRRVALFAHVPGESVGNCRRMYVGRLRNYTLGEQGTRWQFNTVAEKMVGAARLRESPTAHVLGGYTYIQTTPYPRSGYVRDGEEAPNVNLPPLGYGDYWNLHLIDVIDPHIEGHQLDDFEKYAGAYFYNYRQVPGGTAGVRTAVIADPTDPQSDDGPNNTGHTIDAVARIGEIYIRVLYKMHANMGFNNWVAEPWDINQNLSGGYPQFPPKAPIRFLLDNGQDSWIKSRFAFNQATSRNVVDVFLMFATSMNNEFFIGDSNGGTATVPTFAAPGWTTDEWAGYALHVVEGARAGETRTIASNAAAALTLDRALSGVIGANEAQIRNSLYDVLPLGWGLGIHNSQIDIDSFESVRDKYLQGAEVGIFCLGDSDTIDIWELLLENLCRPYGFIPYISRATGKLSCVYVGETLPDGIVDDYIAVTTEEIIELGDIEYSSHVPVAEIALSVRDVGRGAIHPSAYTTTQYAGLTVSQWEFAEAAIRSMAIAGPEHTVRVRPVDIDQVFDPGQLETMTFRAMFNSIEDDGWVAAEMANRIRRHATPDPQVSIRLGAKFLAGTNTVHVGSLLSITDSDKYNPVDPFNGGRGWTNQLARVLETKINLSADGPTIDCVVQLLSSVNGAKIAPACTVTAKGNDAGGDYFTINATDFVVDEENDRDDDEFEVDDLIELRSITGAHKEDEVIKTIDTANNRIYVDGAIASAIAAGDYITFQEWSNSNTDNMDDFAGLADSNETLGAGNDEAKEYA
jgi:hypothetical protein